MRSPYIQKETETRYYLISSKLIYSLFALYALTQWLAFFSSIEFQKSHGASEFLLNYADGVIRRGLFGSIILLNPNIPPMIFGSLLFLFLVSSNLLLLYILFRISYTDPSRFLICSALISGPAFFMFRVWDLQAFPRKDILSITILFAHLLTKIELEEGSLKLAQYGFRLKCILSLQIFAFLMHETSILLFGVHFYFSFRIYKEYRRLEKFHREVTLLYSICLFPIICLLLFFQYQSANGIHHSESVLSSIPKGFIFISDPIQAIDWGFSDTFRLVQIIWYSNSSLVAYGMALLTAITSVWFLFKTINSAKIGVLGLLSISPTFLLFITGWDYGRWISIVAFTFASLLLFERYEYRPSPVSKWWITTLVAMITIWVSLHLRLPHCCLISLKDVLP